MANELRSGFPESLFMKRATGRTRWSYLGSIIAAEWSALVCLAWLSFAVGCGGASVDGGGRAEAVLTEVVKAYAAQVRSNRYQPPANEEEFKAALQKSGDGILKRAGVKTVDQLFISPRDSQPFVISYGKDARRLLERGIVAYERTGTSGRRLVGFDLGYVEDVDEQTFKRLLRDR